MGLGSDYPLVHHQGALGQRGRHGEAQPSFGRTAAHSLGRPDPEMRAVLEDVGVRRHVAQAAGLPFVGGHVAGDGGGRGRRVGVVAALELQHFDGDHVRGVDAGDAAVNGRPGGRPEEVHDRVRHELPERGHLASRSCGQNAF